MRASRGPPALRNFPPNWGTWSIAQALRGWVVCRSGDSIPGNRRRHRNRGRRGKQSERCVAQGSSGLVWALQLHARPVKMCAHFCPGDSNGHMRGLASSPRTLLQVPLHSLKRVPEFSAPLTSYTKWELSGVSLPWRGRCNTLTLCWLRVFRLVHRPAIYTHRAKEVEFR